MLHRFEDVKQVVVRGIRDGRYRVGQTLPDADTLARRHRCSTGTIRRALTELADAGVVRRIRARGTIVVDRPRLGRARLVLSIDHHTNLALQNPVYAALTREGFAVEMVPAAVLTHAAADARAEADECLVWLDRRSDADASLYADAFARRVVYAIDPSPREAGEWMIGPDWPRMSRLVVQHLLKLDHRKIAVAAGWPDEGAESWSSITAGFARDLIEVAGGACFPLHLHQDGPDDLRRLVVEQGVTAIWTLNDHRAVAAEVRLAQLGLSVPRDVSIVGRWDTPWCGDAPTPLTSVSLNPPATADAIADAVTRLMQNETPPAATVRIPPELIVRSSTSAR